MLEENEAINKTAALVSDGKLKDLKFYGTAQVPLLELESLLHVLKDVPREILLNSLSQDEYIKHENTIYLKDTGWYAALCMTKLEIGKYFRLFISNLIKKLWETNPDLLIQVAEETKEQLAALRLRYKEQRNEYLEAQTRIDQLKFSINGQEKRSRKAIELLNTAKSSDNDYKQDYDLMCKKFLTPIYVFMVPTPKTEITSDDEDEEEYDIYDTDLEPDAEVFHYYNITTKREKKKDASLVKIIYTAPKAIKKIKEGLARYKINSLVYKCSLSTISDVSDKLLKEHLLATRE